MAYLSDIEIAQQCEMKHIAEIAEKAEVLQYIEQTMTGLEEAMSESEPDDQDYFEGKYQALYELQTKLLNIGGNDNENS